MSQIDTMLFTFEGHTRIVPVNGKHHDIHHNNNESSQRCNLYLKVNFMYPLQKDTNNQGELNQDKQTCKSPRYNLYNIHASFLGHT